MRTYDARHRELTVIIITGAIRSASVLTAYRRTSPGTYGATVHGRLLTAHGGCHIQRVASLCPEAHDVIRCQTQSILRFVVATILAGLSTIGSADGFETNSGPVAEITPPPGAI